MKRRELFWMIVPCLLLAGGALYYTRRETLESGPFRWRMVKVTPQPLTPDEVARGCASKWQVDFVPQGQLPPSRPGRTYDNTQMDVQNWRLTARRNGREKRLECPEGSSVGWNRQWDERKEMHLTISTPRLDAVPDSEILFKAELVPQHYFVQGGWIVLGESGKAEPFLLRLRAPQRNPIPNPSP